MLALTCNFLSNPQYQKIHFHKFFCFHSHLVLLPFFNKSLWGLDCKAFMSWNILRYKSESFSWPQVFSSKTAVCKKEFISIFLLNFSGCLYITISGASILMSIYRTNTAILRKSKNWNQCQKCLVVFWNSSSYKILKWSLFPPHQQRMILILYLLETM